MSIVKMKKLRLIAVRSQRDDLMKELMLLGCVQVREPKQMLSDPETAELLRMETTNLLDARAKADELATGLRLLDRYAPAKSSMFARRPEVERAIVLDESAIEADLSLARRIRQMDEKIRAHTAQQSSERASLEALRPWAALDFPLESPSSKTCTVVFGSLPAVTPLDQAADALEAAVEESQIIHVSSDDKQHCFLFVCMKDRLQEAVEALRPYGFSQVTFPGLTGTAKQNIAVLEAHLWELAQKKDELIARIESEKFGRGELKLGVDRMAQVVARAEAAERLRGTDSIVAMEGWCPVEQADNLAALLAEFDCAWELSDPVQEEYPDVPIKLNNNRLTRPLNMVTDMYSLPAYDGLDPNPLMAPFFITFFGLMMADMGYGALMMILSLFVLKKAKPKGGTRDLFELAFECGITTFIMGLLTGSLFGDAVYQFLQIVNPASGFTGFWALFTPLGDIIYVLVGSMVLGVIQIITGMAISLVKKCHDGQAMDAVFNEVAWWIIYAGVALLAFKIGNVSGVPVVLCAGLLLLLVGQCVTKKSFFGGLGGLFGAIYNGVTGIFGDILSYTRIMALMLAGSVIAQVFNTLAGMTNNVVFFIIIFLFGHTINFGLNLLGCYVHDLRLQCLEFFGKFYKDGGKPFKPLCVNTKYVDIIKEEN